MTGFYCLLHKTLLSFRFRPDKTSALPSSYLLRVGRSYDLVLIVIELDVHEFVFFIEASPICKEPPSTL
jgi:hypothetical protein